MVQTQPCRTLGPFIWSYNITSSFCTQLTFVKILIWTDSSEMALPACMDSRLAAGLASHSVPLNGQPWECYWSARPPELTGTTSPVCLASKQPHHLSVLLHFFLFVSEPSSRPTAPVQLQLFCLKFLGHLETIQRRGAQTVMFCWITNAYLVAACLAFKYIYIFFLLKKCIFTFCRFSMFISCHADSFPVLYILSL